MSVGGPPIIESAKSGSSYGVGLYAFLNGVVAALATFISTNVVFAVLSGWNFSFWGFVVVFGFIGAVAVAVVTGLVSLVVAFVLLKRFRSRTRTQRAALAAAGVFAGLTIISVVLLAVLEAWNAGVILVIAFILTSAYVFYATIQADRANSAPKSERSIF